MFIDEYFATEEEVLSLIQEAVLDQSSMCKEKLVKPIIDVMEKPANRKKYIDYGNHFLEANAEMLAKEDPTKKASYPHHYVDDLLNMFGFNVDSIKKLINELEKEVKGSIKMNTTLKSKPTSFIHTVVLVYADMTLNRELRDSARQQMGLSLYDKNFSKYFEKCYDESVMAYTYMELSNAWNLVKCENIINWIGDTMDIAFQFCKSKLSIDMDIDAIVFFLQRTNNAFNQNFRQLGNKYYANLNEGKGLVGKDTDKEMDQYIVTNSYTKTRENIMRLIKNKDPLYYTNGDLYAGIARLKSIKRDDLYKFAMTIEHKDISMIIDNILYVFIVKEGNSITDINSTKYIGMITKTFPTQVDRCIKGKPVVLPMCEKYKVSDGIVKGYISLIATYILNRVNDIK